ncbi:MAG: hypothetical protein ACPGRU_01470, partial [Candidatus Puniceispirillaceae bacterium]
DIPTLMTHQFGSEDFSVLGIHVVGGMQTLLFLAFFASFAVKMPMWRGYAHAASGWKPRNGPKI